MAALTAVAAHLRIPLPYVPLTLQPAVVCLAGLWLGSRAGAMSQLVYVIVGLVGFPVFAKGGGPQYVLEPSFGYLIGFIPGAFTVGYIAGGRDTFRRTLLAVGAGLLVIYLVGVIGLYANLRFIVASDLSLTHILQLGLAPLPKDLLIGGGAAWAGRRLRSSLPL
ncbi:MAG: biotin transporter BioY [Gemmatimonadetes bacterium]|nr:biotin transporter BioY [Gemmatimonadota bacterium]MBT6147769.1 biotin transporter BioY [Gemmatimonadota bacterium]MBT7862236.1 biotin transporter BioY [Gemmatimonadota bacterium]